MFQYKRSTFLKNYPQFQESSQEGLYCRFDKFENLVEVSHFQYSIILKKFILFQSLTFLKDRIVETNSLLQKEWIGSHGNEKSRDKDQFIKVEKWNDKEIFERVLQEMIKSSEFQKVNFLCEYDIREIENIFYQNNELYFSTSSFSKFPALLSEKRFKTWLSYTTWLLPSEYEIFFNQLDEEQLLDILDEDNLGKELSKYITKIKMNLNAIKRRSFLTEEFEKWLIIGDLKKNPTEIIEKLKMKFLNKFLEIK